MRAWRYLDSSSFMPSYFSMSCAGNLLLTFVSLFWMIFLANRANIHEANEGTGRSELPRRTQSAPLLEVNDENRVPRLEVLQSMDRGGRSEGLQAPVTPGSQKPTLTEYRETNMKISGTPSMSPAQSEHEPSVDTNIARRKRKKLTATTLVSSTGDIIATVDADDDDDEEEVDRVGVVQNHSKYRGKNTRPDYDRDLQRELATGIMVQKSDESLDSETLLGLGCLTQMGGVKRHNCTLYVPLCCVQTFHVFLHAAALTCLFLRWMVNGQFIEQRMERSGCL